VIKMMTREQIEAFIREVLDRNIAGAVEEIAG
jgi:hypothetical protein